MELELKLVAALTTLLNVCCRREEGVEGGVPATALRASPHMLQRKVGISDQPQSCLTLTCGCRRGWTDCPGWTCWNFSCSTVESRTCPDSWEHSRRAETQTIRELGKTSQRVSLAYWGDWERIVAVLQQVGGAPPSVSAGVTSETGKYL